MAAGAPCVNGWERGKFCPVIQDRIANARPELAGSERFDQKAADVRGFSACALRLPGVGDQYQDGHPADGKESAGDAQGVFAECGEIQEDHVYDRNGGDCEGVLAIFGED